MMKNVILLSLGLLLWSGCKTEHIDTENTATAAIPYPAHKIITSPVITVDSFQDKNVKEYIRSYDIYIEAYAEFVASRDMDLLDSLRTIGEELAQKVKAVNEELSEEEIQKLNIYMKAKSIQLQQLSKQLED